MKTKLETFKSKVAQVIIATYKEMELSKEKGSDVAQAAFNGLYMGMNEVLHLTKIDKLCSPIDFLLAINQKYGLMEKAVIGEISDIPCPTFSGWISPKIGNIFDQFIHDLFLVVADNEVEPVIKNHQEYQDESAKIENIQEEILSLIPDVKQELIDQMIEIEQNMKNIFNLELFKSGLKYGAKFAKLLGL